MLTYGSYMKKDENIPKTAVIVSSMNILVSILAAIMIFSIIFTFGFAPEGGFGLVFKTLPVLFAKLPGSLLLSTIFFSLLVFTALTSSVALLEVVVANFIDLFQWSRKKAVIISAVACYIFGIPSALSGANLYFPPLARDVWKDLFWHDGRSCSAMDFTYSGAFCCDFCWLVCEKSGYL